MDKKELQHKLNQPYNPENWKEVVKFVFPNVSIFATPREIPIKETDREEVERFLHIGNVQLKDGKILDLLELHLKDKVNLLKNRVRLNDIVSSTVDMDRSHGVLSVFEKGTDDFRFTFSAKASEFDEEEGDFVVERTDTKRFTYLLGKNESCKTPAERFYALSEQKQKADLKAVEDAFSVEKLSKRFFDDYVDQYNSFVSYLTKTPGYYTAVFNNDEKKIRDFVKIFLGRIVFIKFVQKKGWMGAPADQKGWENGDYRFLENAFKNFEHKDNFYSEFLNPLFFKALDKGDRPNDVFELTGTKVPFLSGGLFDNHDPETRRVNFPKEYFESLFEFLDRYNFTIDENDVNDQEIGIDPEMLGHIFENLLEDNKDKGAFYTPKEIVRYMCRESLKEYLKANLQEQKLWPKKEEKIKELEEGLDHFINKREAGGIIDFEGAIANALKTVKICDPAIGSGAFPMGLLQEIFHLMHLLYSASPDKVGEIWELDTWRPNVVKQNIIQNSIYGVDIEKGAVDIARLRFWLSLIVDEPEPTALPHLDYKIVVGNSLLSKFEDTTINIDWEAENPNPGFFGSKLAEERADILNKIGEKQKQAFEPESDDGTLSLEIRDLKIDLLIKQLEVMIEKQNISKEPKITNYQNKPRSKFIEDQKRYFETLEWKQQIKRLKVLKEKPEAPLNFFDWKLDFPEILSNPDRPRKGFDIVIANPPYVDFRSIESGITSSQKYPINLSSNRPNLYQYFIELGDLLLKENGSLCFINPNQFLSTNNGLYLRRFLIEERSINFIVDVSYLKVFSDASTYTSIWLFKKNKDHNKSVRINRCNDLRKLQNTSFIISQEQISNTSSYIIPLNEEYFLLTKLEDGRSTLAQIATLKWGTSASGYGKKKIHKDEYDSLSLLKKKGYKPILQTSDTKKYYCEWQKEFIPINIFSDGIKKEFEKKKIVIGRVTKRIQACIDQEKRYVGKATVLTDSTIDLEILLAILNSSLINQWYYLKFETTHMAGGYLRYDIPYLSLIPIPSFEPMQGVKIKRLVTEIINKKTARVDSDTEDLELAVDISVCKMFNLDYDQIIQIDPFFQKRLNRRDYEEFNL